MAITNGYVTLNEVKDALNLEDSIDNAALEMAIATASRQIDDYCGRFFYKDGTELAPATRYYTPTDYYIQPVDDFVFIKNLNNLDKNVAFYIFDMTGRLVEMNNLFEIEQIDEKINVCELKSGIYTLLIQTETGNQTFKIIKL